MFNGEKVTLLEMLDAREQRVATQKELLETAPEASLLSATMNIPGEVKNSLTLTAVFLEVIEEVEQQLLDQVPIVNFYRNEKTGPEYYLAVSLSPQELKKIMVKIEETHPYGRLVDLDVLWGNEELKSLHRGDLGLPPRRCFVCQEEAKVCGRNRRHSIEAMQEKITEMILTRKEQPSE